ncbi:ADP-ribosylglycohydrolase family protein [Amycolatopsis azurea]|uniref:ADP-ribosylglycohydrolase n=1 Tax=Amycolatopsis azurea DSM 43854 TaxID=1238180 RepID=M2NZD9_9PSEU|nr:ADP-ribosylglycohydrolase family protein [Amycolatopsis azurea]EMD28034.1 ADP-ribosylglycohydrolase [Amycolatopsis azurea DSM 43854]OOC05371.1 hypothetical protein B0293_18205 [Amycolatopsis azurea DSM 43854]
MNAEEAAGRVEEWLRTLPGDRSGAAELRVRADHVVSATGGWNVTYNTVGWIDGSDPSTGLFPSPVAFVPEDGGEIRLDLAAMASSTGNGTVTDGPVEDGFTEWAEVTDPEYDREAFAAVPVPKGAVLRWEQRTLYGHPTGAVRENPDHRPGPGYHGLPVPASVAEKAFQYHYNGWFDLDELYAAVLDLDFLMAYEDDKPAQYVSQDRTMLILFVVTSLPKRNPKHVRFLRTQPRDIIAFIVGQLGKTDGVALSIDKGHEAGRMLALQKLEELAKETPRPQPAKSPARVTVSEEQMVKRALKNGFELTVEEIESYRRAFELAVATARARFEHRQAPELPADLWAHGLVTKYTSDGDERPSAWDFGKFFSWDMDDQSQAWFRIVGAYIGFALGDSLGSGAALGGLTRQLLFHTESVIRALPGVAGEREFPASMPPGGRPDSWITKVTAHAGSAPAEFSSMLAMALAASVTVGASGHLNGHYVIKVVRELVGSGAPADVMTSTEFLAILFRRLNATGDLNRTLHAYLEALVEDPDVYFEDCGERLDAAVLEAAKTVVALHKDFGGEDAEQFDGIGDGRGAVSVLARALFAAMKRGHEPEAALTLAARGGPVIAALTGALTGARTGVPGLPGERVAALTDLGLVEDIATDAYFYFHRFGLEREPGERQIWDTRRYPREARPEPEPDRAPPEPDHTTWLKDPAVRSRWRGSLLAGAIGDALGAKTEFDSIDKIREIAGPDGITDLIPAYGGVGKFTDDTQMTLFTLEAMIRAHAQERRTGEEVHFARSVQMAYQRWLHTQGVDWARARGPKSELAEPDGWLIGHRDLFSRRAPGLTCFSELEAYGKSGVMGSIDRPVNNSKGSGGVMRAAPLALWSSERHKVFFAGMVSGALTHGHPSGYLSAAALAVIVHELLKGSSLLEGVKVAQDQLEWCRGAEEQREALDQALALAGQGGPPTPEKIETLGQGNVGETALSIAVYVALTTTDANAALLASVNHSGDSDSTGSVCGNLVGAMYGEEALRTDWLEKLELAEVIGQLADDALAEFGGTAPGDDRWYTRYPAH